MKTLAEGTANQLTDLDRQNLVKWTTQLLLIAFDRDPRAVDSWIGSHAYKIGQRYFNGDGGSEKNLAKAALWYHRAAERGVADAQFTLGCLLAERATRDLPEAAKWFREAATQGHKEPVPSRDMLLRRKGIATRSNRRRKRVSQSSMCTCSI